MKRIVVDPINIEGHR
nr:NiFe hydrogenase large subunit=membrane-bound uptake hydrogenase homolog {N-terminal} [Sporomusa sphaeroides, DSM 2875, Peptide Partial, 15 aa] [Sporomusa sphaeroides]